MDADMLATPIDKLPPPALQTNAPLGEIPNYKALAEEVQSQQPKPQNQHPVVFGMMPTQQQSAQQQFPMQQQQSLPMPQQQLLPMPMAQPPQQHHSYYDEPYPPRYAAPPPPPPPAQPTSPKRAHRHKPRPLGIDVLKSKKLWVLVALMFAFVTFVIPKLKTTLPFMVNPIDGRVTTPGLFVAAFVSALGYTIASDTVLQE